MTKNYFQLTPTQRYQTEALKKAGHNQSGIAAVIGVHKSTISRELRRNVPQRGIGAKIYNAQKAQSRTDHRHKTKHKRLLFSTALKAEAVKRMEQEKLSPELISAVWKRQNKQGVSHETIYKFIRQAKFSHRKQYKAHQKIYLLLKHGRRHRKRGNYKDSRGAIPNPGYPLIKDLPWQQREGERVIGKWI